MKTYVSPCIDELIEDRDYFNSFVYTPIDQAIKELETRKDNVSLSDHINKCMPNGIPSIFNGWRNAILGRQLATPNFELKKFDSVVNQLPGFKKTTIVMHKDKFTPGNNVTKYHLGKIVFSNGSIQSGTKSIMAVDFNENAGKKISEVKTIWGQSLIDFHNELMDYSLLNTSSPIQQFEGSEWLSQLGKSAKEYYPKLLLLFLQNGLLFENFLLKEKFESTFTRDIFLPAFLKIIEETGKKPLIVSFLPMETEVDNFWNFYSEQYYQFVHNKIEMSEILRNKAAA